MDRFQKDKTAKWLINQYGDLLLRHFGGIETIERWMAGANDITVPKQVPDGYIKVWQTGNPEPREHLVEIASYPDNQIKEQLLVDIAIAFAANDVIPETLLIVLKPKHKVMAANQHTRTSSTGKTGLNGFWTVVNLWELSAEQYLAADEPGLAPWIVLMDSKDTPETLTQKVRNIIDAKARDDHRLNLLAAAQIFVDARFHDPKLTEILGGQSIMIDSPMLNAMLNSAEARGAQQMVLRILRKRFNEPLNILVIQSIQSISDLDVLEGLLDSIPLCTNMDEFQHKLDQATQKAF